MIRLLVGVIPVPFGKPDDLQPKPSAEITIEDLRKLEPELLDDDLLLRIANPDREFMVFGQTTLPPDGIVEGGSAASGERGLGARAPQKIRGNDCQDNSHGRRGELSELKGLVVYLASDASSFMTGQVVVSDGGICV